MRKLGYTALALGAALVLSLGVSGSFASAEGTEGNPETTTAPGGTNDAFTIESNYNDTLYLSASEGTKEILVGTAKTKGKAGAKVLSVSSWDTYEVDNGEVRVDLSKLAITKQNIICIKADAQTDDEALNVVVPASVTKLKVAYDKTKGSLTFTDNKSNYTGNVIYRTANDGYDYDTALTIEDGAIKTASSTSDVKTGDENNTDTSGAEGAKQVNYPSLDLSPYRMTGATLYFAVPTSEGDADGSVYSPAALKDGTEVVHASDGTTALNAITLPARQGKEAKVTIGKLANAPKVSANYKTGVITVPKNTQYRVIKASAKTLDAFSAKLTDKKLLTIAKDEADDLDASEAFAIDVKTVADGKLDSKIGHYTFKAQEATSSKDVTKTAEVANSKGGADITLKNISETYAYKVTYTGYGKTSTSTVTINKKTEAKKISKVATESSITVERVGDSKTQTWPGTVIGLDGSVVTGDADDKTPAKTEYTVSINSDADFASMTVDGKDVTVSAGGSIKVAETSKVVVTCSKTSDKLAIKGSDGSALGNVTKSQDTNSKYVYSFDMPSGNVTVE